MRSLVFKLALLRNPLRKYAKRPWMNALRKRLYLRNRSYRDHELADALMDTMLLRLLYVLRDWLLTEITGQPNYLTLRKGRRS